MPDLGYADSSTSLTEHSALSFLIRQILGEVSTGTPVQVVKAPYDRDGNPITPGSAVPIGFIDVQPLVNQMNGDGSANPHGTVYRLSYHRYQGGNGALISDPAVADQGHMAAADRDTSVVKQTNAQGNPGSNRRFDRCDGTYFGMTQGATAPGQYITFLVDGIKWHDKDGNEIVTGSSGTVITTAKGNYSVTVQNGIVTVTASGNITLHSSASITLTAPPGTITANGNPLG